MLPLLLACAPNPPAATGPGLSEALAAMVDRSGPMQPVAAIPWQSSSTDPRSTRPDAPHWFANDDRGHMLAEDSAGFTIVDQPGPGMLTRIWSANPERGGTLKIYVDGQSTPVYQAPMDALLGGRAEVPAPLAEELAGGSTLHLPIPYARQIRVTLSENRGKGVYWVAQGLRWTDGRSVRSLSMGELAEQAALLTQTAERLGSPERPSPVPLSALEPGGRRTVELSEPGVITELRFAVEPAEAAQDLWLVARFDGVASVDVPLIGLVGMGSGTEPYQDWWRSALVHRGRWLATSRFPMPYRSHARIEVHNRSDSPALLGLEARTGSLPSGPLLRFTGTHRTEDLATRPRQDWTLAEWQGPGVLVADTLSITNPVESWWGGGDEKLWVDGVLHRGTGTEDYYGLAWCSNAVVHGPFGGQARNDRSVFTDKACEHSGGTAVVSRARVADLLPFARSLRFDLGVRHRDAVRIRYEATVLGYSGAL